MTRAHPTVISALRAGVPRNSRLLLGVSGGMDSMALLCGLHELNRLLKIHIEVAHIDHGLRTASQKDSKFVKDVCVRLKLPCHILRTKPPKNVGNIEAWGRRVRYDYFGKILRSRKLTWIVTAHTANDAAETFLMRLVSNKELTGIARTDPDRCTLRPLLSVTRKSIQDFVRKNKIEFVEDSTNFDEKYLRNRVRHKLVKLLEQQFDPEIVEVVSERSEALQEDIDELRIQAAMLVPEGKFGSKLWLRSLLKALDRASSAMRWRIIEEALLDIIKFRIGRRAAVRTVDFFLGMRVECELPGGYVIKRASGGVELKRKAASLRKS